MGQNAEFRNVVSVVTTGLLKSTLMKVEFRNSCTFSMLFPTSWPCFPNFSPRARCLVNLEVFSHLTLACCVTAHCGQHEYCLTKSCIVQIKLKTTC